MSKALVDQLLSAVAEDRRAAAITVEARYRPSGGGTTVMPPTFENGSYLREERWVEGERRPTVVLDQVPSQANRVEEALLAARDGERIHLPLFELIAKTSRGPVRLTSLQFPHRYADAYLRDSELDGKQFDKTDYGERLRAASAEDCGPLYQLDPGSLIFGAWDSHRKGRWPKFARTYSSFVFALEPAEGQRRGTRMDPLNLVGAVDDAARAEGDWGFVPTGEKVKGQKLSEIGHGNIPPVPAHGGVSVTEVRRVATISLAGLERLHFGGASTEATRFARAALAALALAGDRLAFDRASIRLRSGCDLTRLDETLAFELDGGDTEPLEVDAGSAIDAFHQLRYQAAGAGISMADETISLKPGKGLAAAIEYAMAQASDEEAEVTG